MYNRGQRQRFELNNRVYFVEPDDLGDLRFWNIYDPAGNLLDSQPRHAKKGKEETEILRCLEAHQTAQALFLQDMGKMFEYKHVYLQYCTEKIVTDIVVPAFVLADEMDNSRSEFHEPAFLPKTILKLSGISKTLYDEEVDCWRTPVEHDDPFYDKMHQAGHGYLLTSSLGKRIKVYNMGSPAIHWRLSSKRIRDNAKYYGRHYNMFSDVDDGPHNAFLKVKTK